MLFVVLYPTLNKIHLIYLMYIYVRHTSLNIKSGIIDIHMLSILKGVSLYHRGVPTNSILRADEWYIHTCYIYCQHSLRFHGLKQEYDILLLTFNQWNFGDYQVKGYNHFFPPFPRQLRHVPCYDSIPLSIDEKFAELYLTHWAPSQYKDRLIYVWRFPC